MIGCMLKEGPISIAEDVHVASVKADVITMLGLLSSQPVVTSIIFNESEIILSKDVGLGIFFLKESFTILTKIHN